MEIELDARRVEAIEETRRGGGFLLRLDIRGQLTQGPRPRPAFESIHHPVNQATWVEVLAQMGYGRTLLLEVPMPAIEETPRLADSVKHLEKAQQAMLRGEWREAAGCCRDVLEALADAVGDADVSDPEVKTLFVNARAMGKDARLRSLRRALMIMSPPARHADQVATAFEWERRDARVLYAAVAMLVSRYGSPKK